MSAYEEPEKSQVADLINEGKRAIDKATSTTAVNNAKNAAQAKIDKVPTKAKKEADALSRIESLTSQINSLKNN